MAFIKNKYIWGIFISILTIFAMSHNANAINVNLENYTVSGKFARTALYCEDVNGQVSTGNYCAFNTTGTGQMSLDLIRTNRTNGYTVKKGDIVEFYLTVFNTGNYTLDGGSAGIRYYLTNGYGDVITLNYEQVDNSSYLSVNSFQSTLSQDYDYINTVYSENRVFRTYKVTQLIDKDLTGYQFGFDMTGNNEAVASWYQLLDKEIAFSIHDFVVYTPSESKENKEVEEKTQEAVDESQSAGSSSSSSASQGGANLLSAITGFFNVITSAQPSNCRFNAPLNTYFGNERLNVDLCALDLPSGIGALTSIIAIGILIPFAIHMFNKFIALFRSFQS